jgi:hypothetical protein
VGVDAEIQTEAGERLDSVKLIAGAGYVFPDQQREFMACQPFSLPDGVYQLEVRVRTTGRGGGPRSIAPFTIRNGQASTQPITDDLRRSLAGPGFAAMPRSIAMTMPAGSQRRVTVELTNTTSEPIPIRARVVEWVRRADGRDLAGPGVPANAHSGCDLVAVPSDQIALRPRAKHRIAVNVSLPSDATGEHYAAVLFEGGDATPDDPLEQARRCVLIGICAEGSGAPVLDSDDVQLSRLPSGQYQFLSRLHNPSDVGAMPTVRFGLVTQAAGQEVTLLSAPATGNLFIQAGMDRIVTSIAFPQIEPGSYTAQMTVEYPGQTARLIKEAQVVVEAEPDAASAQATDQASAK